MAKMGETTRRWRYSRVGWMARTFKPEACHRCNKVTDELYKAYVETFDMYRSNYARYAGRYCKLCIERLWQDDDTRDEMRGLDGQVNRD